jgi:PAS domain S-box-containing protein
MFSGLRRQTANSAFARWLLAAAVFALGLSIATAFRGENEALISPPFVGAIAVITWWCGVGPAAAAILFSSAALYAWIHAAHQGAVPREILRVLMFAGTATLVSWLIHRYQRSANVLAASEKRARDKGERLRAYLEAAAQGILSTSQAGRIELVNRRAEQMFGYPRAELIGRELSSVLPQLAAAEAAPAVLQARRRDGMLFPAEIAVSRIPGGEGEAMMVFITDVTERRLAEEAVRAAHHELQAVIDTAPVAIYTADADGRVLTWSRSAERIFGYAPEEALGHYPPYVMEADLPDYLTAVDALRTGQPQVNRERRRRKKNGDLIDVVIWATPLEDAGGRIVGAIHALADDTERKVLQTQLVQSQRMEAMGRLASFVAHDFNNMLTAIIGFSDLLSADVRDPRLASYTQEVQRAAERASALTAQLLAFSRRRPSEPSITDLNTVVVQIEKMLRRIIGEDIRLETRLDPSLPPVKIDPGQVDQIILNLAVNARDAMPEGGSLRIETATIGDHGPHSRCVRLSVTDTGTGMDSETIGRIFEPFFTTKSEGKGSGLGLSIVRGVVRQSGGDIEVSSQPGHGSTFSIYLPLAAPQAVAKATAEAPHVDRIGTETVLLVEDEPAVRALVGEILEGQGYQVLEAESAADALRLSHEHPNRIDLLLTDVVMPHLSGTQIAGQIVRERPEIAVLFMSGYADTNLRSFEMSRVRNAFIAKPFTAAGLKRKVAEVLRAAPASK